MKTAGAGTCSGGQVFIGRTDSANQLIWWLGCRQGGTPAFAVGDKAGSYGSVTGTSVVTDGAWHHVVGRRDAVTNVISLYIDGQEQASTIQAFSSGFDSGADLDIGWLNLPGGYYFQGQLDEVALYKDSLDVNEIVRHYTQGSAGLQGGYCGCPSAVKVMPLGDSITLGLIPPASGDWNDYAVGCRQKLYIDLTTGGYTVDFVGSQQSGGLAVPPFEIDHEGHLGYYAVGGSPGDIASNVYNWLTANPADVVLLHIGTNDVAAGTQSASSVSTILDNIYAYNPNITVVLARIIKEKGYETQVTQYNNDVAAMAANRILTKGNKIVIVDQENALDYADDMAIDGIHPNQLGYDKMSGVWLTALQSFLPVCATARRLRR